jgi:uncharacterized repeat protein (TIGR02543 family)
MPDMNLVYTAQWKANTYTVSLNGNGGNDLSTIEVTYNSKFPALPDSSRTGYAFSGWFTAAEGGSQIQEGDTVKITENITLYAHWKPNTYIVSFNLNGEDGEVPGSINVTYDSKYNGLPVITVTKKGYHFDGWYTAVNGGVKIDADTDVKITSAQTLYARLAPNTYTVKFDANGGSGTMETQKHTYDENLALTENKFTRTGHTFTGWDTKADGSGTHYSDKESVINLTETQDAEITLYAQWSINSYTVIFNSDGTAVTAITQEYNTEVAKPADPEKRGYTLAGWLNGDTEVSFPLILTDNLSLTAKWTPVNYAITYKNVDDINNNNPASYTIESDPIELGVPGPKLGYTFEGWYTDEAFSETSRVSGVAIASGSTGARIFYAKWKANQYGINFDDGTESNNAGGSMSAQTFTYDVEQPLSSNEFSNPGYRFIGWGTAPNSEVIYKDGERVKNLLTEGSITLYAQWELINYTISYTLFSGATGANNPTSYTIETFDIVLEAPTGIHDGYQFLGWYNGDNKIDSIPKGSTDDVALTAKWAHGGIFKLAVTGEKPNGSYKNVTFTVTRSLPVGADATTDPQHVYYRTVNGTAIGGTAAPIHFNHVGGENVYLIFNQDDTAKTFTVTQESYIGDNIVNSFTDGTNRYYDVELYKVISTVGNCTGILDSNFRVRRTLTQGADYKLSSSFYSTEYSRDIVADGSSFVVKDVGYDKNTTLTILDGNTPSGMNTLHKQYSQATGSEYGLRLTMDLKEINDGYQYIKMYRGSSEVAYWYFETKPGEVASSWGRTLNLPMTASQGDIKLNTYTYSLSHFTVGSSNYMKIDLDSVYTMKFNASGNGSDDWEVGHTQAFVKVYDTSEPTVKRIAPMAEGQYKAGDSITIAVEFNEVIGSATGVSLNKFSQIPVNSWTYVEGKGTNVLVFKGTKTEDYEVDNVTLVSTKPTVKGTIKDLAN